MRDRVLLICIRTRLHALLKLVVALTSSHAEYQYSVSRCHLEMVYMLHWIYFPVTCACEVVLASALVHVK